MRVWLAVFCWLIGAMPAAVDAAVAFPSLEAPLAYQARAETPGLRYEAFLRLRDRHFFVLHELLTLPGGQEKTRCLTGTWHQMEDGAVLQLANSHGLLRRLNVGAAGALYGDLWPSPERSETLVFRATADQPRPHALVGFLTITDSRAVLRDTASEQEFALVPDARVRELGAGGTPLFVDVDVREHGREWQLERVRSASPRQPAARSIAREARPKAVGSGQAGKPGASLPGARTNARSDARSGAVPGQPPRKADPGPVNWKGWAEQ